jgi:type II secretory pathway component PulF
MAALGLPEPAMSLSEQFVERQLLFLQRAGLSRAEAEGRLEQEIPGGGATVRPDEFSQFLHEFSAELGVHREAVEQAAREFRSEAASAFQPVWRSLMATAAYAGIITGIAVLLVVVANLFLVPQFEYVYKSFGGDLPAFTRLVFVPLQRNPLIVVMVAGALLLFWSLRGVARVAGLARREPGSISMRLYASLGLRGYWLVLLLALMRGACRSGMDASAALELAQRIVDRWTGLSRLVAASVSTLREPLLTASRLGTLDAELAFLIEERWRALPQQAVSRAEFISLAVNILVAMAIGMVVIALYLPIFKLASVIG